MLCEASLQMSLIAPVPKPKMKLGFSFEIASSTIATFLKSVEIVIAGRGIELLPMLKESQKNEIYSKLQYDL